MLVEASSPAEVGFPAPADGALFEAEAAVLSVKILVVGSKAGRPSSREPARDEMVE